MPDRSESCWFNWLKLYWTLDHHWNLNKDHWQAFDLYSLLHSNLSRLHEVTVNLWQTDKYSTAFAKISNILESNVLFLISAKNKKSLKVYFICLIFFLRKRIPADVLCMWNYWYVFVELSDSLWKSAALYSSRRVCSCLSSLLNSNTIILWQIPLWSAPPFINSNHHCITTEWNKV